MHRLPAKVVAISRKLGKPVAPQPSQVGSRSRQKAKDSKSALAAASNTAVKPADAALSTSRRRLGRVTSESTPQVQRPTAMLLQRSATDLTVAERGRRKIRRGLDRQPSLAEMTRKTPTSRNPAESQCQRLKEREINLQATAHKNVPRVRDRAGVESQLRDAISTLKKPNRQLLGQETFDTAELRLQTVHSYSKWMTCTILWSKLQLFELTTHCDCMINAYYLLLHPCACPNGRRMQQLEAKRAGLSNSEQTAHFGANAARHSCCPCAASRRSCAI